MKSPNHEAHNSQDQFLVGTGTAPGGLRVRAREEGAAIPLSPCFLMEPGVGRASLCDPSVLGKGVQLVSRPLPAP